MNPIRLLLIEDNPGDALLLREELTSISQSGFRVIHAENLADGLRIVQQQPIDAILLDLTLPDSEGMATLKQVGTACSSLPIIVLTGLEMEDHGIEAVRLGAQDYLIKGKTNPDLLSRSIHHAIERKTSQRSLQEARNGLEQKVMERTGELEHLNQVLQMVISCNQALVRAGDEATLLRQICEIIIGVGNYRMAWVGFAMDDADKKVELAASAGFESSYLDNIGITWADTERGQGPTGTAIRTSRIRVGSDFLTDPELEPWREAALVRGFRSSIALPLISDGRTLGALSIYASRPAAFDEKLIKVLEQLADDLTFGLVALRTQGALRRVEREVLEATEREQQRIGSDLHDSIQGGLVGIAMMLEGMNRVLAMGSTDPAKLTADIEYLIGAVKDTLHQTRGLVRGLCPPELKFEGLMKALKSLASTTTELFGVDCGFRCETHVSISDEIIAMQLYRICQEAVNNAVKHSKGKSIMIVLEGGPDELTLEVKDDGVGLPNDACLRGGMGLGTMDYRARMIGARLVVRRGDEGGTMVRCAIHASPAIVCSVGNSHGAH